MRYTSLFIVARWVGTLLSALYAVIGISELTSGLGPTGHLLTDLILVSPACALIAAPLLGWLGGRWIATGGMLLLMQCLVLGGIVLWNGGPDGTRAGTIAWGGGLLMLALWALVGMVYLREWWLHRPHRESPAGTGAPHAASR